MNLAEESREMNYFSFPPGDSPRPSGPPLRLGVLCYNLCTPTVELLNRIGAITGVDLRAYPLVEHQSDVPVRTFDVGCSGRTRIHLPIPTHGTHELAIIEPALGAIAKIVHRSDAILCLGLQAVPALALVLAARLLKRPVAIAIQSMDPANERARSWTIRLYKRFVLSQPALYLAQTPPTFATLKEVYGISPTSIIPAPFSAGAGVIAAFNADCPGRHTVRRELGIDDNATALMLYVGSLYHLKGLDVLIEALAGMEGVDCKLVIAGSDLDPRERYLQSLKNRVEALNLGHRVMFVGRKNARQIAALYCAADIFVLPTRKDTWPKVLIEAAVAGLPLVTTTSCGAAGTLVRNGINGFVVRPGHAGDLRASLVQLCAQPELRRRLGEAARATAGPFIDPGEELRGFAMMVEALRAAKRNR
jgi:glycosyltransferase involved in cell wall biosynthesis